MAEIMTLPEAGLLVSPKMLEPLGLHPGDPVAIEIEKNRMTIAPAQLDLATLNLLELLRLPGGSLKDRALNPDEQISLEDEIGGSIYDDDEGID